MSHPCFCHRTRPYAARANAGMPKRMPAPTESGATCTRTMIPLRHGEARQGSRSASMSSPAARAPRGCERRHRPVSPGEEKATRDCHGRPDQQLRPPIGHHSHSAAGAQPLEAPAPVPGEEAANHHGKDDGNDPKAPEAARERRTLRLGHREPHNRLLCIGRGRHGRSLGHPVALPLRHSVAGSTERAMAQSMPAPGPGCTAWAVAPQGRVGVHHTPPGALAWLSGERRLLAGLAAGPSASSC